MLVHLLKTFICEVCRNNAEAAVDSSIQLGKILLKQNRNFFIVEICIKATLIHSLKYEPFRSKETICVIISNSYIHIQVRHYIKNVISNNSNSNNKTIFLFCMILFFFSQGIKFFL